MKKFVIRLLFALVCLLTSANMLAENKLWIAPSEGGKVAVQMLNDANAGALQFTVVLPAELDMVTTEVEGKSEYIYRNTSRLPNTTTFNCKKVDDKTYTVYIFTLKREPFIGTEGPVAFFNVKNNQIDVTKPVNIELKDVVMGTVNGDNLNPEVVEENPIVLGAQIVVNSPLTSLVVNPGEKDVVIPFALTNSVDVQGLQFDVQLPKGFTLSDEYEHTARVNANAQVNTYLNNEATNTYRLMLVDIFGGNAITNTGSGDIFYGKISVPEEIPANSSIVIKNVLASYGATPYNGDGATIKVIDGNSALANANATIQSLNAELASALATIAETCPDVADQFPGTAIQEAIDALEAAVNAAYADKTLTSNYNEVMAPAEGIQASIAQLLADAQAAQKGESDRQAANQAAYDADIAAIAALQKNLDDTVAVIDADYADYKDQPAIDAVQAQIDAAKAAADAELAKVEAEGNYVSALDQAAINTAIDGLLLAAQAAKAAADAETARQAANLAAYNDALAQVAALQTLFDNTVAEIKADYADYENQTAEASVQAQITAAKDAVEAAYTAVANEGEFVNPVDVENLTGAIQGLLDAAKAAKEKAEGDAETARQQANQAAYTADMDALDALYAHYRAVVDDIQKYYKEYEDVSAELSVRNQLDAAKADVEKAYKAVAAEGTYQSPVDIAALTAAVDQLLADAKAKKEAADAEAARKAANEAAYNAVVAELAKLQANLDVALATVVAQYPEAADQAQKEGAVVAATIAAAKATADAEYTKVQNAGAFEYLPDYAAIQTSIDNLLAVAQAESTRQKDNLAAYNAVVAQIEALQAQLNSAVETIKKDFAAFEDAAAEAAIQTQLDALKSAAQNAYAAVEKEGTFNWGFDAAPISAAIEKLLTDAKNAADAEADRAQKNLNAYNAVKGQIDALQAALDDAIASIKKDFADFENVEAEQAVQNRINDVRTAADAAYAAVAEEGEFTFTFDAAPIAAEIQALIDAAKNAKDAADAEAARQAANLAAYNAVLAQIEALQNGLNAAVATIKAEYAEYEDAAAEAAIQNEIDKVKTAADAVYAAVEKAGNFEYTFDADGVQAAIDQLLADAKAKKAAADAEAARKAANEAAYNAVLDQIKALQSALDATVAEIKSEYPDYEDAAAEAAVQAEINAVKTAADAVYAAVEKAGNFEYTFDADGIQAAIDQLLADAKAKKEAADAEAARKAANEAAYNAVLDQIKALQDALDTTVATIADEFPGCEPTDAINAIQSKLDALKAAADQEYADVAEAGNYGFAFDAQPILDEINALVALAKQIYDETEGKRVEANAAAYQAVLDELAKIREELDATSDVIIAKYPDYSTKDDYFAIIDAIKAAEDKAAEEYAAVEKEGDFTYTPDYDALRAMIKAMEDKADDLNGVDEIEAEVAAGKAMIFTLDGKQHQRPVSGEVNVIVRQGKTTKVMVD